jgi:hypothetical protein
MGHIAQGVERAIALFRPNRRDNRTLQGGGPIVFSFIASVVIRWIGEARARQDWPWARCPGPACHASSAHAPAPLAANTMKPPAIATFFQK